MANTQNLLTPEEVNSRLTPEEMREKMSMMGKKSVEARRRKKTFREIAEAIGKATINSGEAIDIEEIKGIGELAGSNMSVKEFILWQQISKAMKGDTKAFEVVMGVLGEQPTDKVEVQVQDSKNSLDSLVKQLEE